MDWKEPTYYISLFSTLLFVFSEILPFLPCQSNGLIHLVKNLMILTNSSKEKEKEKEKKKEKEKEKDSNENTKFKEVKVDTTYTYSDDSSKKKDSEKEIKRLEIELKDVMCELRKNKHVEKKIKKKLEELVVELENFNK